MKSINQQHTLQGQEAVLYFTEQTTITVIDKFDFFFWQTERHGGKPSKSDLYIFLCAVIS